MRCGGGTKVEEQRGPCVRVSGEAEAREKDRDVGGRRPVLGQAGVSESSSDKTHGF